MDQERSIRIAEVLAAELTADRAAAWGQDGTSNDWQRFAVVFAERGAVAPYLPSGYEIIAALTYPTHWATGQNHITVIAGHDVAGWTLDDYVIPRLASGLYAAQEVLL